MPYVIFTEAFDPEMIDQILFFCSDLYHRFESSLTIDQVFTGLFGSLAIWLTQCKSYKYRKLAPVAGIISQPFFIYATYVSEQWGMLLAALFCTYAWIVGLIHFYWKDVDERR